MFQKNMPYNAGENWWNKIKSKKKYKIDIRNILLRRNFRDPNNHCFFKKHSIFVKERNF